MILSCDECLCPFVSIPFNKSHLINFILSNFKAQFDAKYEIQKGKMYKLMVNVHFGYEGFFVSKPKITKYFNRLSRSQFGVIMNTKLPQFKNHLESNDLQSDSHSFFFDVTC